MSQRAAVLEIVRAGLDDAAVAAGTVTMPSAVSAEEWMERLELAGSRLHPWIAWQLGRTGELAGLPEEPRALLTLAARSAAVSELRRRELFGAIAEAFHAAQIPLAVLKGHVLAHTVYPVASLRPMADLDLWVEPARRAEGLELVAALGWRRPARYALSRVDPDETSLLEHPRSGSLLELHTRPTSIAATPEEARAVWNRCELRTISGRPALTCIDTDQIAHVSLHLGRKHGFAGGLLGLLDLALCARRIADDDTWRAIGTAHRSAGCAPWTTVALTLARSQLGARVPEAYFDAAAEPPVATSILDAAIEQLWDREQGTVRGVDIAVASSRRGLREFLVGYVRAIYLSPDPSGRPWWRALGARLRHDLTHRVSRYVRAYRRGEFRPARVAHRARMIRARADLIAAIGPPPAPNAPR